MPPYFQFLSFCLAWFPGVLSPFWGLAQDSITIIAVGDLMLGTQFPSARYLPPDRNCMPLIAEVAPLLRNAHITVGNLEGTFCGSTANAKTCRNPQVCYRFCMPDHFVTCLVTAGFDFLSIANNHIYDFGNAGMRHTTEVLRRHRIHFAGTLSHPWDTIHLPGTNRIIIGFTAFSPNRGTLNINDYTLLRQILDTLNQLADIIIVSFHGGAEGSKYTHVPRKHEIFLGENRGNVYEFAHKAIDYGADLVIGHGPHVPRAFELYRGRFIAYSLGNFLTYKRFNLSGPNGIAPLLKVALDTAGRFLYAHVISVYQDKHTGVHLDSLHRAFFLIQHLTKEDFPETPLEFHPPYFVKPRISDRTEH